MDDVWNNCRRSAGCRNECGIPGIWRQEKLDKVNRASVIMNGVTDAVSELGRNEKAAGAIGSERGK